MASSLYIHIPFCMKRCIYCDFVSGIYDPEKAGRYIDALINEIEAIPSGSALSTLYIGGGTPSALAINTLSKLFKHSFNYFDFKYNYEASIEANPGTLDKAKLWEIRNAGINRVSIGVQSFDDAELRFLGRMHTSAEAEGAVHLASEGGFTNVGIDLIYGIPGQTIESWESTLTRAVSLKPDHISTYELTVEPGTPLSRSELDRDDDEIIKMYGYAVDYLTAQGFGHYEISNFARPGYECKHNLNYWDRGDYYGAGLGAHSFIEGKRFHNTDDLDEYLTLISQGKSPVKGSEIITPDTAVSEAIFLGLRKTDGIHIESFARMYHINLVNAYEKELNELQDAGLIELVTSGCSYGTDLRLTRKGLVLSNEVFKKFM